MASKAEEVFAYQCRVIGLAPVRELVFARPRRWRFDFAFEAEKLAIEIEGGIHTGGRHTRGAGFEADCRKYLEATVLGWRVLRVTPAMVKSGEALDATLKILGRL